MSQSEDAPTPSGPAAVSPPAAPGSASSFRVLIADDDRLCRAVLRSMLRQHTSALVIEAEDGGRALDIIQQSAVDAVFLDLKMPVMDGLEVLAALRADVAYRSLPVIVLSAHSDPATVRQAIKLGITDYLVKPLRPRLMESRLLTLHAIVTKRQAARAAAPPGRAVESRRRVLLVDGDADFAAFFTGLFEADHEVVHVDNGREAARVLAGWTPEIACLGPGLRLPSELELARKLRRMDGAMLLYLCAEVPALTGEAAQLFDALLPRTLVPETFRKEFARLCAAASTVDAAPTGLLDDRLREDLITATRQTLGVTTTQEVRVLSQEEAAALIPDFWATVELGGAPGTPALRVGLGAPRAHAERLTERMVGEQTTPERAVEAFGELINTIGGRVVSGLEGRGGLPLKIGPPVVTREPLPEDPDRWTIQVCFETAGGERLLVAAGLVDTGPGAASTAPAQRSGPKSQEASDDP